MHCGGCPQGRPLLARWTAAGKIQQGRCAIPSRRNSVTIRSQTTVHSGEGIVFKRLFTAGAVSGMVFAVVHAQAQQAQPEESTGARKSGDQIEQVIVTSQKRREDVEKIPLSVSVLSADNLKDDHITDFTDLARNVPNLSFSSQAGGGLSTLEIRGISTQAGSATVGVYLDEVSLTTRNLYSQGTAEPRFFDLERVEVLRGPQGTLYGAGSLGGTTRFIRRQPRWNSVEGNTDPARSRTDPAG